MQHQNTVQEDPDHAWKPNNRPQSTVARNFMNELDSLFNLDSSLDTLDKTVHDKKQAVSTQAQELEALHKRLREAEERLNKAAATSPPRQDAPYRAPTHSLFPNKDTAPASSSLAARHPQTMDIPERPHSAHSRASVKV
ncbi:uncharacterized protein EKO05_0006413 [Ascochyta rabiei]|uniref:Uncharacterized protein n=1 Tax=Didymella rabiei TaxID=5454 RepID=A0A162WTP8_DIDRA|nr:uncharacterized protein EKO05_0006413 [Ascochyta rabiei]KZM19201.1 hypothetical protein ST47_g9665 [Ascochyta rabiei]UPX15986.1 hypothetical protein EKO05_0006413 [Ascochyta rabiei]